MATITLFPVEDAYVVGNAGVDSKNFGKDSKLWIASDSCGSKFSITGKTHETAWSYLKFKLPDYIKPEWITNVSLHLFIADARFVGSSVQVTDLAIKILHTTPDWSETSITWANKLQGTFIQRTILKSCQETGICGKTGWCQVGGSFRLGHVKIPLLLWKVYNNYISLIIQPGADNNAMWAYSKDAAVDKSLKPYLVVNYEEREVVEEVEKPAEITPEEVVYPKKVDLLIYHLRGLRKLVVKIDGAEKTLSVGDSAIHSVEPDKTVEIVAYPVGGLIGYKAKVKPAEGKEVYMGFPWKVRIKNAEVV